LPPRAGNIVNCYDQASALYTFAHALGIPIAYCYAGRFGYINAENIIGIGLSNNPFYPLSTSKNKLLGINGITDEIDPVRLGFGNHAYCKYNETIYDACAGPYLGSKTEQEYFSASIDKSTPAESSVAGNSSTPGAVTSLK
jgi:hypothetical protein